MFLQFDIKIIFVVEYFQLMSKMAPLLGQDMTEREFLPRFCEMCTDPLFHVRKVGVLQTVFENCYLKILGQIKLMFISQAPPHS